MSHPTKIPNSPVSFRLSAEMKKTLAEKAEEYGLSPGEFARILVVEALTNEYSLKILDELARLLRTTQALRLDVETATLGLLITAGEQPEEEARSWIDANLGYDA